MQIRSVGIDLGKTTFHLVALSAAGKVLLRKKFTQKQLITFTANMQSHSLADPLPTEQVFHFDSAGYHYKQRAGSFPDHHWMVTLAIACLAKVRLIC
jgi:hypothetical protein